MSTGCYYTELEYLNWWLNSTDQRAQAVRARMVMWAKVDAWITDYNNEDEFLSSYDVCKRAVEALRFNFYDTEEYLK